MAIYACRIRAELFSVSLGELRHMCATRLDEIFKRDFKTELGPDVDREKISSCADKTFERDQWIDHIAETPEEQRQRSSKFWLYLDGAYFLDGMDCHLQRPSWRDIRTIQEIKMIMERNATKFSAAYQWALKRQPDGPGS